MKIGRCGLVGSRAGQALALLNVFNISVLSLMIELG